MTGRIGYFLECHRVLIMKLKELKGENQKFEHKDSNKIVFIWEENLVFLNLFTYIQFNAKK